MHVCECQVDSLSHIQQEGSQGLPRGAKPDGGREVREGLTQEVAWEVGLRKGKE